MEKIIYDDVMPGVVDTRPQERTVVKVTGWGAINGYNLTTLSRNTLEYPILPMMTAANVQIYFELPFVLVNLATTIIVKAPKGFIFRCPSYPGRKNYKCQSCFDF